MTNGNYYSGKVMPVEDWRQHEYEENIPHGEECKLVNGDYHTDS